MIKWIVFDLDDTLLDTSGLLIPLAKSPKLWDRVRQPLPTLEGALENLDFLRTKYSLALLTLGDLSLQQQKLSSLGLAPYFKKIFFANASMNETKEQYFAMLKKQFELKEGEFLSIGNRIATDLTPAKCFGGGTCWFRHGEHSEESTSSAEPRPDYIIHHHRELIVTCNL